MLKRGWYRYNLQKTMPKHFFLLAVLFFATALSLGIPLRISMGDDSAKADWIRGFGENLQMRLQGEVLEADGSPAQHYTITGQSYNDKPIDVTTNGSRFESWVDVNRDDWYGIYFQAVSEDGKRRSVLELSRQNMRQSCIDGVELRLAKPRRTMEVRVVHQEKSVPDAQVAVNCGFGIIERGVSDANGIAIIELYSNKEPSQLTAWVKNFRIGGYTFDRTPTRDPLIAIHQVELNDCRNQKIRLLDESGLAVPDVKFKLQIATPQPDFNFIGINENSFLTTDKNGEAFQPWFPNWEDFYSYI